MMRLVGPLTLAVKHRPYRKGPTVFNIDHFLSIQVVRMFLVRPTCHCLNPLPMHRSCLLFPSPLYDIALNFNFGAV